MDAINVEMAALPKQETMACEPQNVERLQVPGQEEMLTLYPDVFNPRWEEGFHCMAEKEVKAGGSNYRDMTDVPTEELRPCCAALCCIYSLFCGFPSCIGCTGQTTVLCCQGKYTYCKLLDCSDEDSRCCACQNAACYLVLPKQLLQCTGQYFCLEVRGAIPCTQKVPCLVTVLGVTCCADFGCKTAAPCTRLGDIIPRLDQKVGKDAGPGA